MDAMKAASRLTLLVLIMAVITRPVLSDSCTTAGLQEGSGVAVSNKDTFSCRNTFCDSRSPEYHIILHGNNREQQWQKVEVNIQQACDRLNMKYILVLVSGYPVYWILSGGFTPYTVFLVGDGTVSQTSSDVQFELHEISLENRYRRYVRNNIPPSRDMLKTLIYSWQEHIFRVVDSGRPFNNELPVSFNYAWTASSWKLTIGEYCCPTSPVPMTKMVTRTIPSISTTIPSWERSTTTTDITLPEFSTSPTEVSGSASRQGVAGIAAGIGAILVVVILTIVITVVCWCCCRKGKRTPRGTTSQTNQLNTVQGLQTIESGATQEAEPNVYIQSHPTPFNYPTGGPQPSTGLVGHPEPPPPYNNVHPIQPPRYSQVIREHNGRVEPTAPTLHI